MCNLVRRNRTNFGLSSGAELHDGTSITRNECWAVYIFPPRWSGKYWLPNITAQKKAPPQPQRGRIEPFNALEVLYFGLIDCPYEIIGLIDAGDVTCFTKSVFTFFIKDAVSGEIKDIIAKFV